MATHESLLRTRAPYDAAAMLDFLTAHAVPGRDIVRGFGDAAGASSSHAIDVLGGTVVAHIDWAELHESGSEVVVPLRLDVPHTEPVKVRDSTLSHAEPAEVLEGAFAVLRRMLDLDADPAQIVSALGDDPRLSPLIVQRPGLRLPGARNSQEFALGTVLGQQVSLAAARTLQGRLAAQFAAGPSAAGFLAAPDVAAIAATDAAELRERIGLTAARAETLRTVAAALAGGLDVGHTADVASARVEFGALRGIGPWSVEIVAMRAMRDLDAYPAGDLILKRVLGTRTERETRELAESWRPYRGYATQHLWADFLAA